MTHPLASYLSHVVHGTPDTPADPPTHHVSFTITETCAVEARFTCTAPEGADCRIMCEGGCEPPKVCRACTDLPAPHCDDCEGAVTATDCQFVGWMDKEDDPIQSYDGPTATIHDGPIIYTWHDTWFGWEFAPEGDTP